MKRVASAAAALVAPGKGILAAGEGIPAMSARLAAAGIPATEENRRACREMLVTTPGLADGISGAVLSDETLRQQVGSGRTFPVALRELGMMTGIRVDTGPGPLAGTWGETVTEGLDGLLPRLRCYARLGAEFATWRAVLRIAPGMPTPAAVRANAQALGRYAAACQDAGLVPVVEPVVLLGGTHTLGHCETVTSMVLLEVMSELHEYGVDFEGVVLKPNMTLPGSESGEHPLPTDVAEATLGTLNGVPATLAGVAFAASGQRPEQATEHLAAMQHIPHLWPLTFSFGSALTAPALAAWRGEPGRREAGQRALARRVAMNGAALAGRYSPELELDPA
ncbi:MAG TPA: class I fructose-bisphosphate aldolase [Streptosporangiaceae bacterium]|nr:class I fructose-bisphosphate aldolase [Streptosporangiaceae bacterium]